MSDEAPASIEELCRLLLRSRLLTAEEIESLAPRWQAETGGPDSLAEFSRWLVAQHFLTDYQVERLLRGHPHNFFLAGYKLLDQLGRGTHTGVYRAIDRVGRLVALKILPPSRARDPQALALFLQEERLGKLPEHVNVVRVVESGEERGARYLVREFYEGESLGQILVSCGRLTPETVVDLALQALEGLRHLHEHDVIHRNLEPANLLLVRPASQTSPPLVKLLHLGLAQVIGEADHLAGKPLPATPAYLAPELAFEPRPPDGRSDLFSLGCILYHALTGQPPFHDSGSRPLRDNPAVPDRLALFVDRLMAPAPDDRFASATQAAQACRALRERGPAAPAEVEPPSWLADHAVAPLAPVAPVAPVAPLAPPPPSLPVVQAQPVRRELAFPSSVVESVVAPSQARQARDRGERSIPPDRRDWLMLLAGASTLLVVQTLALLLARLISALREVRARDDED